MCVRLCQTSKYSTQFEIFWLGSSIRSSCILSYLDADNLLKKLNNIIEFYDEDTSLNTLEYLIQLCPKVKTIRLLKPDIHVIENLSKFPLLNTIFLVYANDDHIRELIELLMIIGRRIISLNIHAPEDCPLDENIFHALSPNLVHLSISYYPTLV